MRGFRKYLLVGAGAMSLAATSAWAHGVPEAPQGDPGTDSSQSAAAPSDSDIVVTAQKRSESINKVPLSIQAFTGDSLRDAGVRDASDLAQVVSGFNFAKSEANTPIYTLRGIGFNTPNLSSTSPVGLYMDEVAYAYPYLASGPSFDIERVEVLKGPQGTLYGRNTTGGLVNFIAAKPTETFKAGISAELGNYETYNFEGFISGPITETLAFRIAGRSENSDKGWQRSISRPGDRLGEIDRQAIRGTLLWTPSEAFTFTLGASYWKNSSDTVAAQAAYFTPVTPGFEIPGLAPAVSTRLNAGQADWGPNLADSPAYKADARFYSIYGRADYQISDAVKLTSLTAYSDVKRDDLSDVDGTAFELFGYRSIGRIKSFSQELRLSGETGRLNWITGAYYSDDRIVDDQVGYSGDVSVLNLLSFLGSMVPQTQYTQQQIAEGFSRYQNTTRQTSESVSAFANAEYEVTDTFKLSGGLRYTSDKLTFEGCSRDYNNNTAPVWNTGVAALVALASGQPFRDPNIQPNQCLTYSADFSSNPPIFNLRLKEDNVAGRVSATWQPNSDTLLYASISRGFKTGVFPVVAANVETQLEPAKQEKVTAYEIGAKLSFADKQVQLNTAAFYYDYRNKQLFSVILDPIFVTLPSIVNVPKSRVYGGEAELTYRPTHELMMRLGASYTKSEITNFIGYDETGASVDFSKAPFPQTPKWQLNGMVSYDQPIGSNLGLQFSATANYQTKTIGRISFDQRFAIDAYTLVNANITLHSVDNSWRVGLFANNLFNENYWTNTVKLNDTIGRIPGRTRTFGVNLSYRY
ncbi:TonB-dependent receptor [Sphingobium lactosutens]|uniref:TonB-dependent receptor n=1 Tax=Sphingobium lactosutens TaxID=522773 RepID=UPI0015BA6BA8|nr:TonB-dependent receptor [Sphingobium lactosutens]NWK98396.1 TonB-dependent receptor [Sphingobium lactosutens]